MAEDLDINYQTLSSWFRRNTFSGDIQTLEKIEKYLGTYSSLLFDQGYQIDRKSINKNYPYLLYVKLYKDSDKTILDEQTIHITEDKIDEIFNFLSKLAEPYLIEVLNKLDDNEAQHKSKSIMEKLRTATKEELEEFYEWVEKKSKIDDNHEKWLKNKKDKLK